MYFLLAKRVVRHAANNQGSADRFAARSTNVESWTVSGPFAKRASAERAAVNALATHTCVEAQVLDADQLGWLAKANSFDQPNYAAQKAARQATKLLLPVAVS